jgi:hypothetical protein
MEVQIVVIKPVALSVNLQNQILQNQILNFNNSSSLDLTVVSIDL